MLQRSQLDLNLSMVNLGSQDDLTVPPSSDIYSCVIRWSATQNDANDYDEVSERVILKSYFTTDSSPDHSVNHNFHQLG